MKSISEWWLNDFSIIILSRLHKENDINSKQYKPQEILYR